MTETLPALNLKADGQTFSLNTEGEERQYLVGPYSSVTVQAHGDASWGTAVLTVQRSNDRRHWYDPEDGAVTIGPGPSMSRAIPVEFMFLRVRATTLEGGADTCELTVTGTRP